MSFLLWDFLGDALERNFMAIFSSFTIDYFSELDEIPALFKMTLKEFYNLKHHFYCCLQMTVNAVKLVLTTSAKEEEGVSSASSVLPDEAGGEVVEKTDGAASSEQPVEDIEANVTQASSQKLLIHKKRSFAGEVGDDMERNEFSRKRLKSETAGQQQPPFYAGEANAEVNERSAFGKESFTSGAVQTANESIPILQTGTVSTSMLAIPF